MHEMVLVHKALDIVLEQCEAQNIDKVAAVHLAVGEASDIVLPLMQDMFHFLARNTVAAEAELVVNKIPLTVRCNDCQTIFPINVRINDTWHCPGCGAYQHYTLYTGNEFYIDKIEAWVPKDHAAPMLASA